mmetsp:Transcript_25471/g.44836  ORF Transcript_25471/g.44836 Transcript_25471/m.44836 type:complete len:84 (-) Transcript_25471:660-911(-)
MYPALPQEPSPPKPGICTPPNFRSEGRFLKCSSLDRLGDELGVGGAGGDVFVSLIGFGIPSSSFPQHRAVKLNPTKIGQAIHN